MIYAGVTANNDGAFALAYGASGKVHYESFAAEKFTRMMDEASPMEARCVIEMPDGGIIETPEIINPAVYSQFYCRSRGIPFMYVKPGTLRRAYDMANGQTMTGECRIRFPEIEFRGEPKVQEEEAKAVLLAKYAKRYL